MDTSQLNIGILLDVIALSREKALRKLSLSLLLF